MSVATTMPTVSRAEIIAFVGGGVLLAMLLIPGAGAMLEYRRAYIDSEPWRLLTAHLVHVNGRHALLNAIAWCVVARLFATELPAWCQSIVLALGGLCVSVGLFSFFPGIAWYRGGSGALHALFFAGATVRVSRSWLRAGRGTRWLDVALAGGGWIKVIHEQPPVGALPYSEWLGTATVPQAHLIGAVCGMLLGLAWSASDRCQRLNRDAAP